MCCCPAPSCSSCTRERRAGSGGAPAGLPRRLWVQRQPLVTQSQRKRGLLVRDTWPAFPHLEREAVFIYLPPSAFIPARTFLLLALTVDFSLALHVPLGSDFVHFYRPILLSFSPACRVGSDFPNIWTKVLNPTQPGVQLGRPGPHSVSLATSGPSVSYHRPSHARDGQGPAGAATGAPAPLSPRLWGS